jgi:cation diffusion facilitator CzcD-associated flavoprotein CzcO
MKAKNCVWDARGEIMTAIPHSDVLIVGAGISGISSAFHLQKYAPKASF